jgi:2,4-dienoyl-CoA reductase-like NADH-dependent reductase (Old Yellow Enzyme family)/thioredoxin reductase
MEFTKLFEPLKIKNITLRNRVVMSAACTEYGSEEGYVTDRLINYYAERAKGGTALLFVEVANPIYPAGKVLVHQLSIHNDTYIPGYKKLTDAVHGYGARIILQLSHAGRQTTSKVSGQQPWAPSALLPKVSMYYEKPREMTVDEIKSIPPKFAEATERAKKAGFDGVELHIGHGYLFTSFVSPYTNKRTDEYGGSLENRMRLVTETLTAIKPFASGDFLITVRMNGDDYVEGGTDVEEGKLIAKMLVEYGTDLISVSAGMRESTTPLQDHSPAVERGAWVYLAEGIKEVVGNIPVIAAKRINRPEIAENILRQTKVDMVAMLRALMADPHLANKAKEGRLEEITTCIACCQGCYGRLWVHQPIECTVNPLMGREKEWVLEPAAKKKKVLVVGGGPGGMRAAIVAQTRGHAVTLCEKNYRMGGQWLLSLKVPHKYEFENTIAESLYRLNKLGVKLELNTEVTPAYVARMKPDAVICATGVVPIKPNWPGINKPKVVHAFDVLAEIVLVGKRACVIGAGRVGLETAEYLQSRGREVTCIDMIPLEKIGADLPWPQGGHFLRRLDRMGVKKIGGVQIEEITDEGVTYSIDGKTSKLAADTVVIAVGQNPNNGLANVLEGKVPELYRIGDCINVRTCLDAIHEGYRVGMQL